MNLLGAADTWVLGISATLIGLAALIVVGRITRGPTMLDRAIAFDVLVAITICAVALDMALRRDGENLPFLLVATLLGFVGSVSIARFSPGSDEVDGDGPDDSADGGPRDEPPAAADEMGREAPLGDPAEVAAHDEEALDGSVPRTADRSSGSSGRGEH